jgi:hypothetical protein
MWFKSLAWEMTQPALYRIEASMEEGEPARCLPLPASAWMGSIRDPGRDLERWPEPHRGPPQGQSH